MEDVLDVYERPCAPRVPVVCMDETSLQLLADARTPLAARPGQVAREDYEYVRSGVCTLFLAPTRGIEPLPGFEGRIVHHPQAAGAPLPRASRARRHSSTVNRCA
jgi:hypothetical protein